MAALKSQLPFWQYGLYKIFKPVFRGYRPKFSYQLLSRLSASIFFCACAKKAFQKKDIRFYPASLGL